MSKGIFALFGVTNTSSLRTVESYTQTFHMPYATPSTPYTYYDDPPGFILRMRPKYDMAMMDIIRHYKWTRMFYIYDADDGKYCILKSSFS